MDAAAKTSGNLHFVAFATLPQGISDVFSHCKRVKKGAVLKYHSDFLVHTFKLFFRVVSDVLVCGNNPSGIRLEKSHQYV